MLSCTFFSWFVFPVSALSDDLPKSLHSVGTLKNLEFLQFEYAKIESYSTKSYRGEV